MKRYLLLTLVIPLFMQSDAAAQRDLLRRFGQELRDQGRQLIQQEFGGRQQPSPGTQQPQSMGAMPSEGGNNSGGGQEEYRNGDGYLMPGQGIQPRPIQPQPQYDQPFLPNQVQPYPDYRSQPMPSDLYYRDPSLSQGTPVYSQPTTRTVSSGDMPSSPVMSNQYAVIRCPETVLGSISYTLKSSRGSYRFTLGGGQEQRFRVDTPWSISYSDGSEQRRYAIRGGKTYTMKMTKDNRWQLFSVKAPGS